MKYTMFRLVLAFTVYSQPFCNEGFIECFIMIRTVDLEDVFGGIGFFLLCRNLCSNTCSVTHH